MDPTKNVVLTPAEADRMWRSKEQIANTPPMWEMGAPKKRTINPEAFSQYHFALAKKALWWGRINGVLPANLNPENQVAVRKILWHWGIDTKWVRHGDSGHIKLSFKDDKHVSTDDVRDTNPEHQWTYSIPGIPED